MMAIIATALAHVIVPKMFVYRAQIPLDVNPMVTVRSNLLAKVVPASETPIAVVMMGSAAAVSDAM